MATVKLICVLEGEGEKDMGKENSVTACNNNTPGLITFLHSYVGSRNI